MSDPVIPNTVPDEKIAEARSLLDDLEQADPAEYKALVRRLPFICEQVSTGVYTADEDVFEWFVDEVRTLISLVSET